MTDWIITNCESVGNMHNICQDCTNILEENKVLAGALADGVSSNKYADIGARLATESACEEMCAHFTEYYSGKLSSKDFVINVQKKILEQSGEKYDLDEIKSTLLLCAIKKNQFILGHIGDGAILCFGKESFVISPPQENEVGGTATYTILDYNAEEHFTLITGIMDDYDGFLLTSDGLLGNLYYSGTDIPQLAFELFGAVYKPTSPKDKKIRDKEYYKYLSDYIQAEDSMADDCSLLMVARAKRTGYVDYSAINGFEADVKWPCCCGNLNRMGEIRCSFCRKMYTEIYPQTIVNIQSKESFFSKLNQWFSSDSMVPFSPGRAAEIICDEQFNSLCDSLKMAAKRYTTNGASIAQNIQEGEKDKNEPQKGTTNGTTIKPKNRNKKQKNLIDVIKQGASAISSIIEKSFIGNSSFASQTGKIKKHTTTKEDPRNRVTQVSFSQDELLQAAYYKRRIPAALLSSLGDVSFTNEQLAVIDVVFNSSSVLEILGNSKSMSGRFQVYHDNHKTAFACGNKNTSISFKLWDDKENVTMLTPILLPNEIFKTEIKACPELKLSKDKLLYNHILWNWWKTYRQFANATAMEKKFLEAIRSAGDEFDCLVASQWFIADRESNKEMIAYLVAKNRLLFMKSDDINSVSISEVATDNNSAFLMQENLFSGVNKEES